MEHILVAAICLLIGVALTAVARRPERPLARVVDTTRNDIAAWPRF